jgi:hypothetical protein
LVVVWKDCPGESEKQFRLRQSFQSARPMSGRPGEGVAKAALQMFVERRFGAGRVVVGQGFVQDAPVPSFLQIGGNA